VKIHKGFLDYISNTLPQGSFKHEVWCIGPLNMCRGSTFLFEEWGW